MKGSRRMLITAVTLTIMTTGCRTHAVGPRSARELTEGVSASTVVTASELARVIHPGSLLDALERLRPMMLSSRGATPLVSIDGSPPADISTLRLIPASAVREVRLLRASARAGHAAIAPNGDLIAGDLLVVSTWNGGR